MSSIRGKDTKPELVLRRGLHRLGFRFRLHDKRLPGKPDIVLPKYRAVILAHGCFWHGHLCHLFKWPSTREEFWRKKITRNRDLDNININKLMESDWRVCIVWECALKGKHRLPHDEVIETCSKWLDSESVYIEIDAKYKGVNE
ncbi:very short patch repair endonuclease [Kroppenstedtia eburnea]